jgi:beta-N-acetylhexosaminidase
MAGFEGHEVSPDIRALIRDYGVGHVILFARNVAEPAQVAGLVRELQEVARAAGHDLPLFVAVDQEGGRVARLREPWTVWPPLRAVGRLRSDDHARQMGRRWPRSCARAAFAGTSPRSWTWTATRRTR